MFTRTPGGRRAALVLVAASAAGLALATSPASAATPTWEPLTVPTTNARVSLLPFDGQNAYARTMDHCTGECTYAPKLWQRTGTTWKQVTMPADVQAGALAGTGPTDLWVFGSKNTTTGSYRFNHYDGTTWTSNLNPDPRNAEALDAQAAGRNSVWAVGNYRGTGTNWYPMVTHWNGSGWNTTKFTGIQGQLDAVDVNSETDVWASGYREVSGRFQGLVLHYDGTRWAEVAVPRVSGEDTMLREVISNGPDDVWVASGSRVSHWDGTAWTRRDTPAAVSSFAYYGGQVYAGLSGAPKLVRWTGARWEAAGSLVKGEMVDQLSTTPDGTLYAASSEGGDLSEFHAYLARLAAPTAG
ncbi:hypothetical protein ABZ923_24705 [Streptomyces sp. NPDC046881]|uniref:hypothetical protein n=1 Tax=Streptomyces sp. NPDC046881 TaxID=3155374 RepID=UPI0033DFCE7A